MKLTRQLNKIGVIFIYQFLFKIISLQQTVNFIVLWLNNSFKNGIYSIAYAVIIKIFDSL